MLKKNSFKDKEYFVKKFILIEKLIGGKIWQIIVY